jgi:uncharacterized membrane protein YebE (DUF533 family)
MNSLITKSLLVAGVVAMSSTMALAYDRNFDTGERRQIRQEERIRNGIRDGSLTRSEAEKLIEEQRRIDRLQASARADGYVSERESEKIRQAQREASRNIYRERHDADRRRFRPWYRWY